MVAALVALSPRQRSCFLLFSYGKFSYKEIATKLNIPFGTVVTHISRGRARMRRQLADYATARGFNTKGFSNADLLDDCMIESTPETIAA